MFLSIFVDLLESNGRKIAVLLKTESNVENFLTEMFIF